MEQKKFLIYQIIALALTVALAIITAVFFLAKITQPHHWIFLGLQLAIIIGGAIGFIILYQKSESIVSKLTNETSSTDRGIDNKPDIAERKEIRIHHLVERYIEDVYPALLRNSNQNDSQYTNQKEAIALLNSHISKIIGQTEKSCINASMNGNIINVVITDVYNNELKLSYDKNSKKIEVTSPTEKYIYRNGCIISIKDGIIESIENPL